MKLKNFIFICSFFLFLCSCANYNIEKKTQDKPKLYFSSSGFVLIYDDTLYSKKVINKKMNNDDIRVMHSILKKNTYIKISNPDNGKVVETKIYKKAKFPAIFTAVISDEVADLLELDLDNPFVEIIEIKKNKTFVAKKSNTFNEEKNVADKVPVDEVKIDILLDETKKEEKSTKKKNFILVISDFYYIDSANSLKDELLEKTSYNDFFVKKINNNKHRLFAGPFKNFNALKMLYISLNELGFEGLNIYKE